MSFGRGITKSNWFQTSVAFLAAAFIKLVRNTCRFEVRRGDIANRFWSRSDAFIGATWHGQNMILPTFWHNWREMRVLVSRHGDGEIIAKTLGFLGTGTIRGAGSPKEERKRHKIHQRGGAQALRAMVRALGEDISIGLTADVPPGPARRAGEGIITLARMSGKPIVPVALTTRARIRLNNWDRYTINLPFSRGALVWGEPIYVPRDADEAELEKARLAVEEALNKVTEEAERLVGRLPSPAAAPAEQH